MSCCGFSGSRSSYSPRSSRSPASCSCSWSSRNPRIARMMELRQFLPRLELGVAIEQLDLAQVSECGCRLHECVDIGATRIDQRERLEARQQLAAREQLDRRDAAHVADLEVAQLGERTVE